MKRAFIVSSLFFMSACIVSLVADAQPNGGPGGPGMGTPPFVTACKGKAEGATCSFTEERENKTYTGTCKSMNKPDGKGTELVCYNEEMMKNRPARPDGQRGNNPPPRENNQNGRQ